MFNQCHPPRAEFGGGSELGRKTVSLQKELAKDKERKAEDMNRIDRWFRRRQQRYRVRPERCGLIAGNEKAAHRNDIERSA